MIKVVSGATTRNQMKAIWTKFSFALDVGWALALDDMDTVYYVPSTYTLLLYIYVVHTMIACCYEEV